MNSINFCKFHGFGNDYIVIEKEQIPAGTDLQELARSICHRHTGAGADGIAVLEEVRGEDADYFCEIVNPDGSIAGFSGNGTRCAVSYLYYRNLWNDKNLRLRTRSGIKNYRLTDDTAAGTFWFEAEIGKPKFASSEVPVTTTKNPDSVIDFPVTVAGREFLISGVNVGNPVVCIFVDEFDPEWRTYGKALESHEAFPEKANIVFIRIIDRENIEIKIWERAAGETSSSGTCSTGAAVLSAFTGRTGRSVSVLAEGGSTKVVWRDDDEMVITGRADFSYSGEWPL
ncbi:MAG: diaminopimelate epimerase [Pyrinomonadaceae bacterium]